MHKMRNVSIVAVTVLLAVLLGSCATRNSLFVDVDKAVASRDYAGAISLLESEDAKQIYPETDLVLRELDLGMLKHLSSQSDPSTQHFNEAERLIEEYFSKSVTEAAGSLLLNDTVMAYSGEAYEDIYLNVFKALNFARAGKFDGAFVEIRRMNDKMSLLEEKYGKLAESLNSSENSGGSVKAGESEFTNSALAHFLSLVLYRADGRIDDAALDLKKIGEAFASQKNVYDFSKPDLDAMLAKAAKPRLTLVGFTGKAPIKKAITYRLNTGSNSVTISKEQENSEGQMVTTDSGTLFIPAVPDGLNFKCQVPYMELVYSPIASADVEVDGAVAGSLQLIEKMDNVALDTFKVKEPLIYTKTIIRTVVKGVAAKLAEEGMNQAAGGLAGFATGLVLGVAADASEVADLRSARFYPGKAWVGDYELDAGSHAIRVIYKDASGNALYTEDLGKVEVKDKGLNLISSYALM